MTKENHESIGKMFVYLNSYKALILLAIWSNRLVEIDLGKTWA